MECLPGFLFSRELLLALVLHGDHHHVGLVDQVGGGGEHDGRLAFLEIFLQCVGELLAVLHKLPLSLLQRVLALDLKIYKLIEEN